MTDGVGRGGADADGREVHDDVGEGEHRFGEGFEETQERCTFGFGEAAEREAEQDGEDGDLQDLVFGDGLGEVLGEHVEEEIVPAQRRGSGSGSCSGDGGCGGGDDADAGAAEIDGGEADDDGDGGDDFEVDQAFQADAADAFGDRRGRRFR